MATSRAAAGYAAGACALVSGAVLLVQEATSRQELASPAALLSPRESLPPSMPARPSATLNASNRAVCHPQTTAGDMVRDSHDLSQLHNLGAGTPGQVARGERRSGQKNQYDFWPHALNFTRLQNAVRVWKHANMAAPASRIVHQSWRSCNVRADQRLWQQHCARVLPSGWVVWLWTDEDNRRLIATDFPEYLEMYDRYDSHIKRIDAVRYFYLHRYGGVYMDLDMLCLRPFESVPLLPWKAYFGTSERGFFCKEGSCIRSLTEPVPNAFLASRPRHPFLAYAISMLPSKMNASYKQHEHHPSSATGPRFLSSCLRQWSKMKLGCVEILRVPVIFSGGWNTRHPCGPRASSPDKYPPALARAAFERCAQASPMAVTTTFWTRVWVNGSV